MPTQTTDSLDQAAGQQNKALAAVNDSVVADQNAPVDAEAAELVGPKLDHAIKFNRKRGYNRTEVRGFQKALGIPEDGVFGPQTTKAVYAFQLGKPNLTNDGMLGTNTRRAIQDVLGTQVPKPKPRPAQKTGEEVATEAKIAAARHYNVDQRRYDAETTRQIQEKIGAPQSGKFDDVTINAIFAWQAANHLDDDGKIGARTLERLRVDVFKPDAAAGGHQAEKEDGGTKAALPAGNITANYTWKHFASHDGTAVPAEYQANVRQLAMHLEIIRAYLQHPITVMSGYRSVSWNKRQGGAANSQHLYGRAVDMIVPGMKPSAVKKKIEELIKAGKIPEGGVGLYSGFTHYDYRGYRARW